MPPLSPPSRRQLLLRSATVLAATAAPAWLTPALAQPGQRPTPSQAEGPFYPVALPADSDFDLLRNGRASYRKGQPAWVEGAFQGFGQVSVGRDGRYRFRTLRPAPYSGRTPHIHVKVQLDGQDLLTTQLYVAGDPGNERDFLWRRLSPEGRAALTVPFVPGVDGARATFPIVVQA